MKKRLLNKHEKKNKKGKKKKKTKHTYISRKETNIDEKVALTEN